MLQQFGAHLVGVGRLLVDLVDRHDDRHLGGARVVDRFNRLRHHAVVGGNHQNHDIRGFCAALAHGGKGFMAWRIDEGDEAVLRGNLVGADVLGNAACFAGDNIGLADGVQQRGLAVVHVAHDGHDRRPRLQLIRRIGVRRKPFDNVRFRNALHAVSHFLGNDLCGVRVDHVVDRVHLALLHQYLDDVDGAFRHAVGQFLDGDGFRNDDLAGHLFRRHLETLRLLFQAFGSALEGGNRTVAVLVIGQRIGNREPAAALVHVGLGARRCGHFDLALDDPGAAARALRAGLGFLFPVSLHDGFRIELLGGFLGLAPAFFFGPVARIVFKLALGCGLAVAQILFVMFLAAQRLDFLLLALFRLANP